ncbi:Sodium:sulfate symporter transmembrane region-domain-containing protein [Syncephalis plumigaleata]|nr:Sodium:sulfate symporter transmembrane region-domain-containing protein [Syncephalis plumigaleata]
MSMSTSTHGPHNNNNSSNSSSNNNNANININTEQDGLMSNESRNVVFYTGSVSSDIHININNDAASDAINHHHHHHRSNSDDIHDYSSGSDHSDAASDAGSSVAGSVVVDQDEASRAVAKVRRLSEVGPDCLRYRISGSENWLVPNEYAGRRSQPVSWASQQNLSRVVSRVSLASTYSSAPNNPPPDTQSNTSELADHAAVVKGRIARLIMLWPAIIVCIVLWNLPPGDGLNPSSMRLLGVFAGVIVALLTTDFEIAFLIAMALTILAMTRSVTCKTANGKSIPCDQCNISAESANTKCKGFEGAFNTVISGYSNEVNWLVFCAFHLGQAIQVTGLGQRVAMLLVRCFGRSLLGLGYAVSFAELLLAPFIPSNAARGGGVLQPVVMSLARTLNSTPTKNRRPGAFLILCGAHLNLVSASLFLTGSAPNPIVRDKADSMFGVDFTFAQWLKGAALPGLLAAILVPLVLYVIIRPNGPIRFRRRNRRNRRSRHSSQLFSDKDITVNQEEGEKRDDGDYNEQDDENDDAIDDVGNRSGNAVGMDIPSTQEVMPSTSLREWMLMGILALCLSLWIAQSYTGIGASLVTFLALVLVLLAGILEWEDVLRNAKAWDSFFWLGGFLVLADQFTALGLSGWFGRFVANLLGSLSPLAACITLSLLYFISMFCFSSITAHAVALAGPFLAAGQALHCPPYVLVALLSYFSALGGCLTNYSSGALVLYFSQGYVPQRQWFGIGGIIAVLYLAIYFGPGLLWWKIIGWL